MKVFIVLPTYNEADNLETLIDQIFSLHPSFNILVVDDNSPDGTGQIADALSEKDPRIHALHRPGKLGLGTAYVEGFKYALNQGADLIFEMDADFSHNPEYLGDFLEASKKADLVVGSRYKNGIRIEGWKFRRLLLSKLANIYVACLLLRPVWDFTSGFRCYKRRVLQTIDLDKIRSDGYAFQIEMIHHTYKHNFTIFEIPIMFKERIRGVSKISRRIVWEALWVPIRYHAPIFKVFKHFFSVLFGFREFIYRTALDEEEGKGGGNA